MHGVHQVKDERVSYPVARLSAHLYMVEAASFSLACVLRACKAEEACALVMRVLGEIGTMSDKFVCTLMAGRHMGPSTGAAVGAAAEELRLLTSLALQALDARTANPPPPLVCAADVVCKMFGHALALLWGVKMDARTCQGLVSRNQRLLTRENRAVCLGALGTAVARVDAFYMHVARSFRESLVFFERAGFVKTTAAGVSVKQRINGHLAMLQKHDVHWHAGRSDRVIDALDAGDDRCEEIIRTLYDAMKRSESHIPASMAPTDCVPLPVLQRVVAELDAVLDEITPAVLEEHRPRCHRATFNRAKAMRRATVQLRDECRSNAAHYRKILAAHRAETMQKDKEAREAERVREQVRSHHQRSAQLRAQWLERGRTDKALRDEITSRLGKARASAAGSACPETQRLWEAFRATWRRGARTTRRGKKRRGAPLPRQTRSPTPTPNAQRPRPRPIRPQHPPTHGRKTQPRSKGARTNRGRPILWCDGTTAFDPQTKKKLVALPSRRLAIPAKRNPSPPKKRCACLCVLLGSRHVAALPTDCAAAPVAPAAEAENAADAAAAAGDALAWLMRAEDAAVSATERADESRSAALRSERGPGARGHCRRRALAWVTARFDRAADTVIADVAARMASTCRPRRTSSRPPPTAPTHPGGGAPQRADAAECVRTPPTSRARPDVDFRIERAIDSMLADVATRVAYDVQSSKDHAVRAVSDAAARYRVDAERALRAQLSLMDGAERASEDAYARTRRRRARRRAAMPTARTAPPAPRSGP